MIIMRRKISLKEIITILKQNERWLKEEFGVKELGVFGSYVRNEQTKERDVDVLVRFWPHTEMNLIKFVEVEAYLSPLLGMKVDVVMKSALKPRIGEQILKEVIYI